MKIPQITKFTIWFGLGAPLFFFGALIPVWQVSSVASIILFFLYMLRLFDSVRTTCSRCPNYGTWNCGLPGKFASVISPRRFDLPSLMRIRYHAFVDWIFMLGVALIWISFSWVTGILGVLWVYGSHKIVYGPHKFHGLLWAVPHHSPSS